MAEVLVSKLHTVCSDMLICCGVPQIDASIVAESIVYAHIREKHTHGIGRMGIYVRKIRQGLLNPLTPSAVIRESPAITLLDAGNGFGQVAGIRAMDMAVEKARKIGIGLVGVKDSNNFGTAGYIAERAVKAGMIGIVLSNSAPAIAPAGSNKVLFGTNPVCLAFPPIKNGFPIILDMAVSQAARGKIRLAAKNEEKIPFGWAIDASGRDTDDPIEALKGAMLPIGGYKGYGLSLCVDLLAGLLTDSGFGGEVRNLDHPTDISRYGHMIIAVNSQFFLDTDQYEYKLRTMIHSVKTSAGHHSVYLPGEQSYRKAVKNARCVDLHDKLINDFNSLSEKIGCESRI